MFSVRQKKMISESIEKLIRYINHPEMDNDNIRFRIHIDGKEPWSFADITDNKTAQDNGVRVNPWNESQDDTAKCEVECLVWNGDMLRDKNWQKTVSHFLKGTDAIRISCESEVTTGEDFPFPVVENIAREITITTQDKSIKSGATIDFIYKKGYTIKKLNGTISPDGAYKVLGVRQGHTSDDDS